MSFSKSLNFFTKKKLSTENNDSSKKSRRRRGKYRSVRPKYIFNEKKFYNSLNVLIAKTFAFIKTNEKFIDKKEKDKYMATINNLYETHVYIEKLKDNTYHDTEEQKNSFYNRKINDDLKEIGIIILDNVLLNVYFGNKKLSEKETFYLITKDTTIQYLLNHYSIILNKFGKYLIENKEDFYNKIRDQEKKYKAE